MGYESGYGPTGYRHSWENAYDKGIELFNKALEISPNHVSALHNLGYAFIETGKAKEAEKLFPQGWTTIKPYLRKVTDPLSKWQ